MAGKRNSEWLTFMRALAILQRLMEGPASGQELMEAVLAKVGPDAYPVSSAARQAAFKRDRKKLREMLGVKWDFVRQKYVLKDAGDWLSLRLPEEALRALMVLSVTFSGQVGEHAGLDTLFKFLLQRLPDDQRRRFEHLDSGITFEIFQQIDPNGIPKRVWEMVHCAVSHHRQLEFRYLSPRYEDGIARRFRVAPLRIVFQWGHWYLFAYVLQREGEERFLGAEYSRFRVFYIQDDEVLKVLPTVVSVAHRRPPRYEVHYRLLPPLGRGAISRHFEEMHITPLEDGSVEVRGVTDDLFEAERILLGYGQYCVVLGGPELKQRITTAVQGMMRNLQAGE